MKKGFTLVEMLIVVVVLVTLMTLTFRLSSIGSQQTYRNTTISRMQRIENCLSGYYAAFGSYPPVKQHLSRNIYAVVDDYGVQSSDQENKDIWGWTEIGSKAEKKAWQQVRAACRSQPVDCRYPFPADAVYNDLVRTVSEALKKVAASSKSNLSDSQKKVLSQGFDNGVTDNIGRHDANETEWAVGDHGVRLFKFGLMSYLLPRYLVMMYSNQNLYGYAQWTANNELPCNPMDGFRFYSWQVVRDRALSTDSRELAEVANIPSQAVTARWMPNLEGIVCCNHDYKFYGINIRGDRGASDLRPDNTDIDVCTPGGYEGGGGQAYVLDCVTLLDGWWHEFYYYSPPPYQSYTLWSAGPNNRTFPPWISRKTLDATANRCVGLSGEDDIVRMSN